MEGKCGNDWFSNSPVRSAAKIYLWEGSDIKWHFHSECKLYKSVPPKSCYSWILLKSHVTNCKSPFSAFWPLASVCVISRFSVSIFCHRSAYLQISAIPMAFICLISGMLCSVWKLTVKLQQWWKEHSCSLPRHLSVRVNCRAVSLHSAKPRQTETLLALQAQTYIHVSHVLPEAQSRSKSGSLDG